ncbi:hypothetical protein [Streptomyces mayteni]
MSNTENNGQQRQMTHFYILTLELPGRSQASYIGELAVSPGTHRKEIYTYLRDQITDQDPSMARANPIYFTLDPLTV